MTCIYQVFILRPGWIFFFHLIIWDGPLPNYLHQIVQKDVFNTTGHKNPISLHY